jgi:hypothetical protein
MKKIIAAAMVAASLVPSVAAAQQPGDWVLSRWRGSEHYFPGVVQSRHGDVVNVRFDDGTVDAVPAGQVRPYNWQVGSVVECRWTDGNWYAATITAMAGDSGLTVRYEDGVVQQTVTGRCRER